MRGSDSPARTATRGAAPALLAATLLAGCTTLGTNVSGSFRCQAPDGVCAPSTLIDDGALAEIARVSSTELLAPAGPYQLDDGSVAMPNLLVASAEPGNRAETYRLEVVFPAFVDARGELHARSSVTTEVRLPGRGDALDALALRGGGRAGGRGLLAAAESAPPLLAIAVPAASATPAISEISDDAAGAQLATGPGPIERIRQEVEAALDAPRRQAAAFPGAPE